MDIAQCSPVKSFSQLCLQRGPDITTFGFVRAVIPGGGGGGGGGDKRDTSPPSFFGSSFLKFLKPVTSVSCINYSYDFSLLCSL